MEYYYNPPIDPWLTILYQNSAIMVLDKPAGLLSVPGKGVELHDSLLTRIRWQYPEAETAHRLDMATSGLIVVALTKEAERQLKVQFQQRSPQKRYIALVEGELPTEKGVIDLPLICDWPNRPKQMVSFSEGREAITHYHRLELLTYQEAPLTRVALSPITGRSHQLRVHLQAIGHPILGDRFYGSAWGRRVASRLYLHADYLSFIDPMSQKRLAFRSPTPF